MHRHILDYPLRCLIHVTESFLGLTLHFFYEGRSKNELLADFLFYLSELLQFILISILMIFAKIFV